MHLPRLQLAVIVVCLTTGCVGSGGLGPSRPPDLEIRGTTLLMPGAQGRLTAWQPTERGRREVAAQWTVEGDVVSISTSGRLIAKHPGTATVRASHDDLVGTTTVHVVTSVAGTWRGSIRVVDCWPTTPSTAKACEGRNGLTAPLVLEVSQLEAADNYDNLRATVHVFTPPAHGSFIGAVDSTGLFFLEGPFERPDRSLSGYVKFRWTLENNRLVPFKVDGQVEDRIDVQLTVGKGPDSVLVNEIWELLPVIR
jgi:hypothetical protein